MRRIFLLTGILPYFLILFESILSIFALKVFFDEQTQLKWTTNYKINKLSFKVAWEKAWTWRQLIGYITTHVVEFSRLSFGSAASVSSDETQVFLRLPSQPPLRKNWSLRILLEQAIMIEYIISRSEIIFLLIEERALRLQKFAHI